MPEKHVVVGLVTYEVPQELLKGEWFPPYPGRGHFPQTLPGKGFTRISPKPENAGGSPGSPGGLPLALCGGLCKYLFPYVPLELEPRGLYCDVCLSGCVSVYSWGDLHQTV